MYRTTARNPAVAKASQVTGTNRITAYTADNTIRGTKLKAIRRPAGRAGSG
jgi:hypothetical protein